MISFNYEMFSAIQYALKAQADLEGNTYFLSKAAASL